MSERLQSLMELLQEQPGDPFLLYAVALEYCKTDPALGIHKLRELREMHPDYLPLYYQLGQHLELTGNTDEAKVSYSEGISLAKKQNEKKAWNELSQALQNLED